MDDFFIELGNAMYFIIPLELSLMFMIMTAFLCVILFRDIQRPRDKRKTKPIYVFALIIVCIALTVLCYRYGAGQVVKRWFN